MGYGFDVWFVVGFVWLLVISLICKSNMIINKKNLIGYSCLIVSFIFMGWIGIYG